LKGDITGTYNIGAIANPPVGFPLGYQSAPVTLGTGATHQFIIHDGSGNNFTANVNWIDIFTFLGVGGLNAGGTINLSGFTYGGTNADLISLASNTSGSVTASFTFNPAQSLTVLTTAGGKTSFSGTLNAPRGGPLPTPAPAGLVLALSGAPFLFVGRLLRRRKASDAEAATLAA